VAIPASAGSLVVTGSCSGVVAAAGEEPPRNPLGHVPMEDWAFCLSRSERVARTVAQVRAIAVTSQARRHHRVSAHDLRGAKNVAARLVVEQRLRGRESVAPPIHRQPRVVARPVPPGAGGWLRPRDRSRARAPGGAGRTRGADTSGARATGLLGAARGRRLGP
jgi:hypothetical protein